MRSFLQDLRYSIRQMRKSPGFATIAVVTLALGIGANTAIFSVVNGVLLNPLPYPQPERLVVLFHDKPNFPTGSIAYLNFLDWQRDNHAFESMAAYRNAGSFGLTGMAEPEAVTGEMVSAGFFEILGAKLVAGRTFTADEDRLGANPTAMISEGLWKRKFGSDPNLVGKVIVLDGQARTVIGILPANFRLKIWNFRAADAYTPIGEFKEPQFRDRNSAWGTDAIARLKPGVTMAEAAQDMARVNNGLAAAYPDADANIKTKIVPLKELMVGDVRPVLVVLLGAVGFVLLIACFNVANLLLARSTARTREFAVRTAMGAGRARLVRQLLTESIGLSLMGGALGLLLATWGTKAALAALPQALPRAEGIGVDSRVLLFTLLLSGFAGVIFGIMPALKTSRLHLSTTLNESGRSVALGKSRTQSALVVIEMAMALVLLVGAGLMIRTLMRLWSVDPGLNPRNVLTFEVALPPSLATRTAGEVRATYRQLDATLHSIPGVESASINAGARPMEGDNEENFWVEGQAKPQRRAEMPMTLQYTVQPEYLRVMQTPLLRGRFLTDADNEHASLVAVIDEGFAEHYFAGQDPIGKHVFVVDSRGEQAKEIVGVVGHVKQFGLGKDATEALQAQIYEPFLQLPDYYVIREAGGDYVYLRTRTGVDPMAVFQTIRRTLAQQNNETIAFNPESMEQTVSESIAQQRFTMMLFAVFAALALLLASVGIYGVLSYVVGQRTQEIGIRMALGAQKSDVLRAVLRDGARMTLLGVGIGVVAAGSLSRLMQTMLFGVKPTDPVTFAAVGLVLCAVALLACYVPAYRAASVDPMQALRSE
ncbi:MAG: ABC transporter permease [Terriglobales bacterium]